MRAAILEINGQLVDLPASRKGVFRFQNLVAALQELETRTGEYAWPLTLPRSRRNDAVFNQKGHAVALDKFFGAYVFRLRIEGQEWRGAFRLTSFKNGYAGALVMDGFGWALALGDKKIPDLTSLAPIAYDGSQLESILAKSCDETDVQFPLLSFGNFFAPPQLAAQPDGSSKEVPAPASSLIDYPLSVDDYYPSVYYVNLVRAILREAGYYAQGPVLADADIRTWCVTAAGGNADAWPWGALLPARAGNGSAGSGAYSYFDGGPTAGGDRYTNTAAGFDEGASAGNIDGLDLGGEVFFLPVPVPVIASGGTRALDGPQAAYTAPRTGSYTFAFSVALTGGHQRITTDRLPTPNMRAAFALVRLGLVVRRGGEGYPGAVVGGAPPDPLRLPVFAELASSFDASGNVVPGSHTGTATVFLEAGDMAQLCLIARRQLRDLPTADVLLTRREFVVQFGAASFGCSAYADNEGRSVTQLNPAAMLPPLSQKEVLRDFLVRTNALLVTDAERGTATLEFRAGHTRSQGLAVDLTAFVDPAAYEPLPVLGTAETLVFAPADAGGDGLLAANADQVRIELGSAAAVPGTLKQVSGVFAATALRAYRQPAPFSSPIQLPTAASADTLRVARSETQWDVAGTAPRVLRYLGVSPAGVTIPFQERAVRFGRADYAGSLAWSGEGGAVARRYAAAAEQARRGHRLRVPVLLTPARYRELAPGRRVWLGAAEYTVESITNWDACDESSPALLELLRVV